MYGQALLDIPCYKILMGCDGKNLQETTDLYNLTDAEQETACRGPDESRHSHLPMPTARAPEPQADLVLRNTCGLL